MTWLEGIGVVMVLVGAAGFAILLIGVWLRYAGDRVGQMADEPATLDVQNHIGDSRPVR